MSALEPGTKATLTGMRSATPVELIRVAGIDSRGNTVLWRVRVLATGRTRTVEAHKLKATPEPTALGGDYTVTPSTADLASRLTDPRPVLQQIAEDSRAFQRVSNAHKHAEAKKRTAEDWRSRPRPGTRPVRQREPRLESPRYLAYVRRHACCNCGASGPSEAHHWSHHGGSTGAKCDDFRTVPLCAVCHRHWHDRGTLPGMDRVASEDVFVRMQRWLLDAGLMTQHARPADMVDALVEAMRKMEVTHG